MVTRKLQLPINSAGAGFPRALALLLLAFMFWGTTVEAAHYHGTREAQKVSAGSSHFSDPASESKAGTTAPGCNDCLICQLHQHFSASIISDPPSIAPLTLTSTSNRSYAAAVLSRTVTTRTGRAPPQNS